MKNIAFIVPGFARDELDTVCIPALQIVVNELKNRSVQITIFAIHYPYKKANYSWNGIDVISLNIANNPVKKVSAYAKLKREFKKVHEQKKFDLIHSFWLDESTYFSQKLSKKYLLPHVATAMGQDVLPKNKWLKKINFNIINRLVVLSEYQKKQWLGASKYNVEFIPFGINYSPLKSKKTIDIVGVGNLTPLKNFMYLLELIRESVKLNSELSVEIIGIGPEMKSLDFFILENHLQKNVKLIGQLSYDETQARIASAKLLIHPSKYESFGMIFIEALSLETHVLASAVGVAYEETEIQNLTFDLQKDTLKIDEILKQNLPNQKIYDVKNTVDEYLKIYNRF